MNRWLHIRKNLFGVSQVDMAAIAGVSQATVSKWETNELEPSVTDLARIRTELRRRRIKRNDRQFFETPPAERAVG